MADDGYKLMLGTGTDLQIYHDGSNSYINDTGTGNLNIKGANVNLLSHESEDHLRCTPNGSVDIYYNNAKKFETTADGIKVTDRVTGSGDLILTTVDSNEKIHMDSDGYIKLETNGTERMRIEASGKFGVGSNSPSRTLHVKSPDANVASFEGHQGEGLAVSSGTNTQIDLIGYDDGASTYNNLHIRSASAGGILFLTDGHIKQNGMKTATVSFDQALNVTTHFDFAHPNVVNYFEVTAIIGYYPGTDYTANIHGLYAYRSDSGVGRVQNLSDNSSSNSGSWSVSNPNTTTIRVTKHAGASSAGAKGFVEVKFRNA
jgi:hypothetical protein